MASILPYILLVLPSLLNLSIFPILGIIINIMIHRILCKDKNITTFYLFT